MLNIRLLLAAILACALLVPGEVAGSTYSCETVDKSAKAFVGSGTSVAVTEKDKNCEFSVGGATSMEPQSGAWNAVLQRLVADPATPLVPEQFYDLLVGLSDPTLAERDSFLQGSNVGGTIDALNRCLAQFVQPVLSADQVPQLPVFTDESSGGDTSFRCENITSTDGNAVTFGSVTVSDFVGLALRFEFAGKVVTLYLSANHLRFLAGRT